MDGVNSFSRTGKVKREKWDAFAQNIHYNPIDVKAPATFDELKVTIDKFQDEFGIETQIVYYLAVAPNLFHSIAKCLAKLWTGGK